MTCFGQRGGGPVSERDVTSERGGFAAELSGDALKDGDEDKKERDQKEVEEWEGCRDDKDSEGEQEEKEEEKEGEDEEKRDKVGIEGE